MRRQLGPGFVGKDGATQVEQGGGDRAANSVIHIIAIGRLRLDPCSQDDVAKRIAADHSKLEAIRYLNCYIAREIFDTIMRRYKEINQTKSPLVS